MPPSQVLQDVPLNFAATGRKAAVTARVRSPLTSHTCWIARVRLALCSYSPCSVLNTCLALCFSFPCSWYDMFIPCDSGCQSKALSMIPPFPTSPAWSPLPGSAKLVARSLYAEDSSRRAGLHALCSVAVRLEWRCMVVVDALGEVLTERPRLITLLLRTEYLHSSSSQHDLSQRGSKAVAIVELIDKLRSSQRQYQRAHEGTPLRSRLYRW